MPPLLRVLSATILALVVAFASAWVPSQAIAVETIHLIPDDRASWRASNVFNFLRPGHNYGQRTILVETSPPGATVDLFYIRSNFQKRYEQAEAPVRIVLPTRAQAGKRDAVMVRAFLEGYRQRETSVRVSSKQDKVRLELEALPNTLEMASHTYFAGRGSLAFLTKEPLQVRVQKAPTGFSVVLAETARGPDVQLEGLRSPLVDQVEVLQLGEDLLVRVDVPKGTEVDLRSRQSLDQVRDLYVYSVEMVPADGGVAAVQRARAVLAAIGTADVSGCALRFDEVLRDALDPAELARALAPKGSFTDPYLRAAMKRLGEVSPGERVAMVDGSQFRTSSPIELTAAMSQPADAKGYLALLRALVAGLEPESHRDETLRSLVAPSVGAESFGAMLSDAQAAEAACRGGAPAP